MNTGIMKKVSDYAFIPGHVYTFNSHPGSRCGEAWGIFGEREGNTVVMEVMTFDMECFLPRRRLPSRYVYVREARHEEIRDFAFRYGAMFSRKGD